MREDGQIALLRYRARIVVRSGDGPAADLACWHTDCYELRSGHWQAVWSQATAISPEAARAQPVTPPG